MNLDSTFLILLKSLIESSQAMKILKISASAFLLSSISAIAADLPSIKSAPAAAPTTMWTGFYVGLNAGGTFGNNSALNATSSSFAQPIANIDLTSIALISGSGSGSSGNVGFIGGGQIGYNWQVRYGGYNFVSGLEADIQGIAGAGGNGNKWTAANADYFGECCTTILSNQRVNSILPWFGTIRSRIGFLVVPSILVYGTGGLAYGGVNAKLQNTQLYSQNQIGLIQIETGTNSYSNTQVGWTVGGGAEWMFMPNWSAKAEYLYYDLGNVSGSVVNTSYGLNFLSGTSTLEGITNYKGRVTGNIIRAGVNYHFNFASVAPVVAKY